MIMIRVLPNSPAVDALVICYENKRIYKHEGQSYFVNKLKITGAGRSSRLEASLLPVWESQHGKN